MTSKLDKFHFGVHRLSTLCGVVAAIMILLSIIITCQMIFVRKALGMPTIWQTEAVSYLVIASTMIGLPYVQMARGHVNMDFIHTVISPTWQVILRSFTTILTLMVAIMMMYFGVEQFFYLYESNIVSVSIWEVRLWIPNLSIPVGFFVYTLQLISDLILYIQKKDINDYIKQQH